MNERNGQASELHQKLCAYVLGEATQAERAEVEAALAATPELRAERARLEATIGLVQKTLGDGSQAGVADQLSPAAAEALRAAAEARRPRPALPSARRWYRSPVLRLAAGIGAIGLTWLALRSGTSEQISEFRYPLFGEATPFRVARNEAAGEAPERADSLRSPGSSSEGSGNSAAASRLAKSEARDDARRELDALGYLGEEAPEDLFVPADEGQVAAQAEGDTSPFIYNIFGDSPPTAVARGGAAADRERSQKRQSLAAEQAGEEQVPLASVPAPQAAAVGQQPERGGGAGGKYGVARQAPAAKSEPQPGAVATGSDEFFLGFGQREVTGADFDGGRALDAPAERLDALGYAGGDAELVRALEEMGYVGDGADSGRNSRLLDARRAADRARFDRALEGCLRRPDERPRDMFFRFWGDNPFQYTVIDGLSTFAADVDTASYTLARRYLLDGLLPEKAQVRTEEFVNYFDPDVPAPLEGTFAIAAELAPSRFGEPGGDSWMLRVVVRGRDVTREERQPLTLTFVIDVSGSMQEGGRLELVKHALRLLLSQLDARDSIAIVAFSNEARVILPLTSARNGALIETAIYQLQANGGTNAEAGLRMGYELARADLSRNSHNRVVLLSDGVANIGRTDQQSLTSAVADARRAGIYLNTVGVGMGNHNDALLEQLADKGDGVCNYVDDEAEARRALVERFTGAFEPIARDVKIQVEFDPVQVQRYRLLGYENRDVADRDFRNDAVDAGEVNAGHQVVALYELSALPGVGENGPLATVRVRWKPPHAAGVADLETEAATEIAHPVTWGAAASSFAAASAGYRRSVLVAQFAEFLRRSVHARSDSLDQLLAEARKLAADPAMMGDPDVAEFAGLVERSRQLILGERLRRDDLSRALDALREASYLQAQLEELNLRLGRDRLDDLEDAVLRLQERIRFLKQRVEAPEFSLRQDELEALEADSALLAAKLPKLLSEVARAERR